MKKPPLPTDLEILNQIYERYYDDFVHGVAKRASKLYVPIKIEPIAELLGVDVDIVFSRLYYHLEHLHSYRNETNGAITHFFALEVDGDRHCVNFPYMASLLAALRAEDRKFRISTIQSRVALIISILALVVSVLLKFSGRP